MERDHSELHSSARPVPGALRWLRGALAWAPTAVIGAVAAIVFAVTVLVIALMASAVLALSEAALRARRAFHDGDRKLLEARNVGGHSWVAYAIDARR